MKSLHCSNLHSLESKNSKDSVDKELLDEKEKNKSHIKSNKFIEARNKIYFNGTPQIQYINSVNPELFNSNVSESNNCYSDNTDTGNVYLQTNPPINYSNQPNTYPQQSYPYYYDPQGMYNTTSVYETSNLQYEQHSYEDSYEGQYLQHSYPTFNPPPPESPKYKSKESHHHHKSKKRDKNKENSDKDENVYKIEVNGINKNISEKFLKDVFGIFGNLKSCKIVEDDDNNRYGIIEYNSKESANKAIQKLNGQKFKGSKITISWYRRSKIILYNLPFNIEVERILNICSIAGEVESIKIQRPGNGKGRSDCQIIFKDKESVNEAKEILEDSDFDGLKAEVIIDEDDKKNKEDSKDDENVYKIEVNGINKDTSEKFLKDVFGIFGNLKSCKLIEDENDDNRCGIIEYNSKESANKAIEKLSGRGIKGSKITIDWFDKSHKENKIIIDKNKPQSAVVHPSYPDATKANSNSSNIQIATPCIRNTQNQRYPIEKSLLISKIMSKKEVVDIFREYKILSLNQLIDGRFEVYLYENSANNAMIKLNRKEYNGKRIVLEWGNERELNTVFVGCLDKTVKENDLRREFSKAGEIYSMKIFRQKIRDKSPNYAYIDYKYKVSIDKAVHLLNGVKIKSRFINVDYYSKKKKK